MLWISQISFSYFISSYLWAILKYRKEHIFLAMFFSVPLDSSKFVGWFDQLNYSAFEMRVFMSFLIPYWPNAIYLIALNFFPSPSINLYCELFGSCLSLYVCIMPSMEASCYYLGMTQVQILITEHQPTCQESAMLWPYFFLTSACEHHTPTKRWNQIKAQ